jgi:hypothetical protein
VDLHIHLPNWAVYALGALSIVGLLAGLGAWLIHEIAKGS